MGKTFTRLLLAAILCGLMGCAPKLVVRHMDFTSPEADVYVDGRKVGSVSYGDEFGVSMREGQHRIKTTRVGETVNAWRKDGGHWLVVITNDVVLALLPKPGADGAP
jgi:hypothetical protein